MFDNIRTQLNEIDAAGKVMAEEQYLRYQEKQQPSGTRTRTS